MLHVAVVRFPLTTMQNVRQISLAFRVPKLIKIGPFLTEFFNKNSLTFLIQWRTENTHSVASIKYAKNYIIV